MILYTDEARESWKNEADALRKKLWEDKGSNLTYLDLKGLDTILEMFRQYVDKEAKEAHNKRI